MPTKGRGRKRASDPPADDNVQFYLRMPRSVRDGLKDLADTDERKLNTYVVRVLKKHVEESKGE